MKKAINGLGWPVFILTLISLGGLIYNFIFYKRLMPLMLEFKDISGVLDKMQIPVAIIFILIFIFHLIALSIYLYPDDLF